jgi:hypothetical protein
MRQMFIAVAIMLCATLPGTAREQVFTPGEDGQIEFVMPSGNVGCIYTPKGGTDVYMPAGGGPELSCDRIAPRYVNITLGPKGPAVLTRDPGEQSCCGAENVFAYGNTATLGDFICSSSTAGLVCETADKKHGLCLSRSRTLHY